MPDAWRLVAALPVLLASPLRAHSARIQPSIVQYRATAAGVPLIVLAVNMDDSNVKVTAMTAQGGTGHSEPFDRMIWRSHPTAAVTGTYFSLRSLVPVGDLVVDGTVTHRGSVGVGFCIGANNEVSFIHSHRSLRREMGDYDCVCAAGPTLVRNGRVHLWPQSEGFHDRSLLGNASRLAIGLTWHNKLLLVATRKRISLRRLAYAMHELDCVEAMNLDAGTSLGMYNRGRMLVRPGRRLTNAILIYDDPDRYERFRRRLAPGLARG